MNINNKKVKLLAMLLAFFALTGCKRDFFDVNENPNNPAESTPRLTLPVAQAEIATMQGTRLTYLGQFIMYNWATPSNWSANQEFARYNVNANFFSDIFENSYIGPLKNLTYIENYVDESGTIDYSIYKGIATILKAYQYQLLVDLYGDVPYSDANQRRLNISPKYDKAEDIYKDNIRKLTEVVAMLDKVPANAENPGSQDVMFGGDIKKWQKFANTLKMRYLLRLTNTNQNAYLTTGFKEIEANGKGFISENASVNPGYFDNAGKLSPFYGYFRNASTGTQTDRGDFTVATDYTINFLEKTNDPRLSRLYTESSAGHTYKGVWQSETLPGKGYTSNDLSKVGPGLIKSATQPQPLILLSEALLLQSEAVVRGYLTGNAEKLYQQAVIESFKYLGVTDAENEATKYYTQDAPNINFSLSTNKIQTIITQKWVALNGTNSQELWIEYNRTGYPSGLPLPESTTRTSRPVRLLYPSSELSRNANNVPKQTADDAFNSKLFYQK